MNVVLNNKKSIKFLSINFGNNFDETKGVSSSFSKIKIII